MALVSLMERQAVFGFASKNGVIIVSLLRIDAQINASWAPEKNGPDISKFSSRNRANEATHPKFGPISEKV